MKKILFAAHDPSSGNIISTLAKQLQKLDQAYQLKIFGGGESKNIFFQQNFTYIDSDQDLNFEPLFKDFQPDLVITGASMGNTIERKAFLLARANKIKTISILDFWMNYVERYSDLETGKKFAFLPDYIFVMDTLAKADMVKLGFPEERLKITGNPYFDSFTEREKKQKSGKNLLYISTPGVIINQKGDVNFYFDPLILNDLLEFLNGKEEFGKEKLIVRPHPKENKEEFRKYLQGEKNTLLDYETNLNQAIDECQFVVGSDSTVLFQAALRKKIVISYQKGLAEDHFICKRLGLCYSAYQKEEFFKLLTAALNHQLKPLLTQEKLDGKSTQRVVENIYQILGI